MKLAIIGGGTGYAAAVTAARRGEEVVLIDKVRSEALVSMRVHPDKVAFGKCECAR